MASHPYPSLGGEPAPAAETARRRPAPVERARAGLRAGLVAAAATAGAVVGFALRAPGGGLAPFATSGRMLLGVAAAESRPAQIAALAAGVGLHVAVVAAWAVLFAIAAGTLRGVRLVVAAALFAAAVHFASEAALPPLLRLGHGIRAFPPQVVVLHAVLALGLAVGMRIALLDRRSGGTAK